MKYKMPRSAFNFRLPISEPMLRKTISRSIEILPKEAEISPIAPMNNNINAVKCTDKALRYSISVLPLNLLSNFELYRIKFGINFYAEL